MKNLLFWMLFPFLIPQAVRLRRTAPRFAAAAGPNRGSVGSGESLNLVGIGDSIIAGVGASTLSNALVGQTSRVLADSLERTIDWSAHGRIGANSGKILGTVVSAPLVVNADLIVLSVGVNDITSLVTVGRWEKNLSELLKSLSQRSPNAVIAVAGIPPLHGFPLLPQPLRALFGMRGRVFDRIARKVVNRFPHAVHVPLDFDPHPEKFAADGFHPSEESYGEFGEMVASKIMGLRKDGMF